LDAYHKARAVLDFRPIGRYWGRYWRNCGRTVKAPSSALE